MQTNTNDGGRCRCKVPALRSADASLPYRRCACGGLRFAQPGGVRRAVCADGDPAVAPGPEAQPLTVEILPATPRQYYM